VVHQSARNVVVTVVVVAFYLKVIQSMFANRDY
jgi:hypothetical protein